MLLTMLLACVGFGQNNEQPHKVDSSLRYRWENSSRDTLDWPLTYGWYDTSRLDKREGVLWVMDTVSKHITVDTAGYRVLLRFPPPPNCRCIGKYIFEKWLDSNKHPFPESAYIKTSLQLYYEQKKH